MGTGILTLRKPYGHWRVVASQEVKRQEEGRKEGCPVRITFFPSQVTSLLATLATEDDGNKLTDNLTQRRKST